MNWLKTFSLIIIMSVLVIVAGALVGQATGSMITGLVIALVVALVMNVGAYWFSDKMALSMSGAREVSRQEEPRLHRMVEDIANRAGMPNPRVFVIENGTPNAFATGRDPEHAVVAVTTGIRQLLTERELEGVLAHEMAHIKNRDMLIMTIVAVMATVISFLGTMATWAMLFGGLGRGRQESPYGAMIGLVALLVLIIVMPLAAGMVRFAVSRTREYGADETGAQLLGDPRPLASALEKLEAGVSRRPLPASSTNEAMAHMYIVNPLRAARGGGAGSSQFASLFATHPPIEERVRRLRAMRV